MDTVPPPDKTAHDDGVLMAEVTRLNTRLGRYVLRFLDADAGRAEPLDTDDELTLADQVATIATSLRARAARRDHRTNPPPPATTPNTETDPCPKSNANSSAPDSKTTTAPSAGSPTNCQARRHARN